jgi:hypothetical protein
MQFNESKSVYLKEKEFIEDVFIRMSDIGIKINVNVDASYDITKDFHNLGEYLYNNPEIKSILSRLCLSVTSIKSVFKIEFDDDNINKYLDNILPSFSDEKQFMKEFKQTFIKNLNVCLDQLRNDGYKISLSNFVKEFEDYASMHYSDRYNFLSYVVPTFKLDFYIIK